MVVGIVMVSSKSKDSQHKDILIQSNPNESGALTSPSEEMTTTKSQITESNESTDGIETDLEDSKQTDQSKAKGNGFEDFVVNMLADWRLSLLNRTRDDASSGGVIPQSSKNPDLHVSQKRGKGTIDYYIECKYRSKWHDGKVQFEKWQIERYHKFQRQEKRKVIIALGVGGSPSAPTTFMLVPLDSVKNDEIRKIDTQYVVQPNSSALIEYMNSYFTTVFKKAKEKK